jgi:hypothetical protein
MLFLKSVAKWRCCRVAEKGIIFNVHYPNFWPLHANAAMQLHSEEGHAFILLAAFDCHFLALLCEWRHCRVAEKGIIFSVHYTNFFLAHPCKCHHSYKAKKDIFILLAAFDWHFLALLCEWRHCRVAEKKNLNYARFTRLTDLQPSSPRR